MKKILVVSTINGIAGRNGLTGIFDYVNEGRDWSIRFLQNPGDVAAHLKVSPSLVRERFRTVHGKPLRDVILDMRVKAAMALLKRTKAPVGAVARKTGFRSDAHFVRTFAKRTGATPLEYRNAATGTARNP